MNAYIYDIYLRWVLNGTHAEISKQMEHMTADEMNIKFMPLCILARNICIKS